MIFVNTPFSFRINGWCICDVFAASKKIAFTTCCEREIKKPIENVALNEWHEVLFTHLLNETRRKLRIVKEHSARSGNSNLTEQIE